MINRKISSLLLSLLLIGIFSACANKERIATRSLIGEWELESIKSFYGVFEVDENGIRSAEINRVLEEDHEEGFFTFTKDHVVYFYLRDDISYVSNGTQLWELELESQRTAGFSTPRYWLSINDRRMFEVIFGDQTNGSEKDATELKFVQEPTESGDGVIVELILRRLE